MTHKMLHVSDVNPNDTTGGGGCICSPIKQPECKPPYVIFYGNDMENVASPHVVACYECLRYAAERAEGEVLSAGEHHEILQYGADPLPAPVKADIDVLEASVADEDIPEL
jgi:hypothetical protein